ncbi:Domain unknown function DUF295 [Dillenia turbinata]|uniref:F-box domain-containing protein n=1 Tax=Dillenia turbinata TaxID=194707 RepID=A0AAN8V9Z0_9MAGN
MSQKHIASGEDFIPNIIIINNRRAFHTQSSVVGDHRTASQSSHIMADWSQLPEDLLKLVIEKLHSVEDYIRIGAVCCSWNSVTSRRDYSLSSLQAKQVPWLMLAEKKNSSIRLFYNPSNNNIYKVDLPESCDRRCWGTAYGFMVTFGTDFEINLLHPFSRVLIPLPPQRSFAIQYKHRHYHTKMRPRFFIEKIILSESPMSPACHVVVIYSEYKQLAFTRITDQVWHSFEFSIGPFEDIAYCNGKCFAIKHRGSLLVCEFSPHRAKAIEFAAAPPWIYGKKHLVDVGGKLYLVSRIYELAGPVNSGYHRTLGFDFCKLDMQSRKWEEVLNLGDWTIFLGHNYSFACRASEHPGCKPNCIYFTDDYVCLHPGNRGRDMGIYNCGTGMIDPYPVDYELFPDFCPLLWIIPHLWFQRKVHMGKAFFIHQFDVAVA